MFHVWKLGKNGCRLLVNDFHHFVETNNLPASKIKQNATRYAKQSIERWNNFTKLNAAKARETAQKLNNLHKFQRVLTPNASQPGRSGVAKMAILLSLCDNELVVRHREHWTKTMQSNNAGMFVRKKKEYEWEELPAGKNNRRKKKAQAGSLGERILFKGEEKPLYGKFVCKIPDDGNHKEQALLLQRMCMKNIPAVGQNFHVYSAEKFLLEYRRKTAVPTKRKAIVTKQAPG